MNKRCPRCGGNIFLEYDKFGWHEHCLQCGYEYNLTSMVEPSEPVALSSMSNLTTQDVKKLTSPKALLELLEKHLVVELKQD